MKRSAVLIVAVVLPFSLIWSGSAGAQPRIDSVVLDPVQPHESSPATIWYDDFSTAQFYREQSGRNTATVFNGRDTVIGYGGVGGSLLAYYAEGSLGSGNRKVFFGDVPFYRNTASRPNERFDEVYWSFHLKHQHGWTGGSPAKMTRATSFANSNWAQGMIAHIWDGGQQVMIDPATGIDRTTGQLKSTKYNDFDNLNWMQAWARTDFPIHSTAESGYWVHVEARAKLNTPGLSDGIFQIWIDGRLEAQLTNLNWHGTWDEKGINAIFLEAYWNDGAPTTQSRWFDNFIISTERIGAPYAPRNPQVIKSVAPGSPAGTWQVQASRGDGAEIVWASNTISGTDSIIINSSSGTFMNSLAGMSSLDEDLYYLRIREFNDGSWSPWSHWHQPFNVHVPEPTAIAIVLLGSTFLLTRPRRRGGPDAAAAAV